MTSTSLGTAVPPPTVSYVLGGCHLVDSGVVGGQTLRTESLRLREGRDFSIGRADKCHLRIVDLGDALSRCAAIVRQENGQLRLYARNRRGGTIYQPGRRPLAVPAHDDTSGSRATPVDVTVTHRTVLELPGPAELAAFLWFDVPQPVSGAATPDFDEYDDHPVQTEAAARAAYELSEVDRLMLTAIAVDFVATPVIGDPVASTPRQVVEMLKRCAPRFFEGRSEADVYGTKNLGEAIKAFVKRIDKIEQLAHVRDRDLLFNRVNHWVGLNYPATVALALWADEAGITATLDYDLACAMQAARDEWADSFVELRVQNGLAAARRQKERRDAAG